MYNDGPSTRYDNAGEHHVNSWNDLFLICLHIILFILQSAVLDFVFWDVARHKHLAVVFTSYVVDAIILILLLRNINGDRPALKAMAQWVLYSWNLVVKLAVFYFYIFRDPGPAPIVHGFVLVDEVTRLSGSYAFGGILFLTPLLYAAWMLSASRQLFRQRTSEETFLYFDIALHVMMDGVDCLSAFRMAMLLLDRTSTLGSIHVANGITCLLGLALHALSFPTNSTITGTKNASSIKAVQLTDIYLTRKYVALVSVCVLDIPFIVIRLAYWHKGYGLNMFIAKNIISIPFSLVRLNACRIAERNLSRGVVETQDVAAACPLPPTLDRTPLESDACPSNLIPAIMRACDRGPAHENSLISPGEEGATLIDKERATPNPLAFHVQYRDLDDVGNVLPVTHRVSSPTLLIHRIWALVSTGNRSALADRLDPDLNLDYWLQLRIGMSLIIGWISRVGVVCLVAAINRPADGPSVPSSLFKVLPSIALTTALCLFFCFLNVAPHVDVCFKSAIVSARFISFGLTLWILGDRRFLEANRVFTEAWHASSLRWLPFDIPTVVLGGCLTTAVSVIQSIFFVQSAMIHRSKSRLVLRPHSKTAQQLSSQGQKNWTQGKRDEIKVLSTSSVLVFLSASAHLCPVAFQEFLIGTDAIRAIRVTDAFLVYDWGHMCLLFIVRGISFLAYRNWWVALIYLLTFTLELIDLALTQAVRLHAIKRLHWRAFHHELEEEWWTLEKKAELQNELSPGGREAALKRLRELQLQAVYDLLHRYRRSVFLLSPGDLLPPFWLKY